MSVLIKGGEIVTSEGRYTADVYVEGEKIRAIGQELGHKADETVDARGKYVLPGAIDPHTHLAMPFMGTTSADDFHTGGVAAACGGVTTVIDFVLQGKGESLLDAIRRQQGVADGKAAIDYSLHAGVTDPRPEVIEEVKKAVEEYGAPSFKIFLFYDFRVDDYTMIRLLEETKRYGGLVQVHAENFDIVRRMNERLAKEGRIADPYLHAVAHAAIAEEEAVERAGKMVEFTGSRIYIVHLSWMGALRRIAEFRERGVEVFAETCPQYLLLDETRYREPNWQGAKYVMSPPLRAAESCAALWGGLKSGYIQTVGTDHCPFNFKGQKDMFGKDDYKKIPNGAPGIETPLMLLHSEGVRKGRISLEKMVEVLSTGTARMFGLKEKGAVAVGKDADLVVFDPAQKFTITRGKLHMNVDYTPYEGVEVTGMPAVVFSRGRRVAEWRKDRVEFVGEKGRGRFVKRVPPFPAA
jgi:dihydropyrimidinase